MGFEISQRLANAVCDGLKPGDKILEFGSGAGTKLLASEGRLVYSVEHNRKYLSEHSHKTLATNLSQGWYDHRAVNDFIQSIKFAACLIDGPQGEKGRSGILQHWEELQSIPRIVVDDTHRFQEHRMALGLASLLNRTPEHRSDEGKQFTVIDGTPTTKACVTLASGGRGFLKGVCGQKQMLDDLMPSIKHAVIIESGAYSDSQVGYLKKIGWSVHVVPPIRTKPARFAASRWPRTFTKLALWSLPYDRVVYMDADAVPCKPYYELFDIDQPLAACDTPKAKPGTRFRSGMMVLHPNTQTFKALLAMCQRSSAENGAKLGDQGLLNVYFQGDYLSLNHKYHVCTWGTSKPNVVIGHLRPKPWENARKIPRAMRYSVNRWRKAYQKIIDKHGPLP